MKEAGLILKAIAYIEAEIEDDTAFLHWLSSDCSSNALQIKAFSSMDELFTYCDIVPAESILLITTSNDSICAANSRNIACLGYVPLRDKYLSTGYVIEGFDEIDVSFLDNVLRRFHNVPWIISTTKRCIIRELSLNDLDNLYDLYSKPGMTKYVEPLFSYDEEMEYEKKYIESMYGYFGYGMWLIFDRESGQLIGRAGLEHRNYSEDPSVYLDELELGYMIAPEFQNRGIATEVCTAIIEYAKENLDFDKINCLIDDDNTASIAVASKLGFKHAGTSYASGKKMERFILQISK